MNNISPVHDPKRISKLLETVDPIEAIEHIMSLEALVKDILPVKDNTGKYYCIQEKVPTALKAWFEERTRLLDNSPLLEQKTDEK